MQIRTRYSRERFITEFSGESVTEQSHGEACDINAIVARHARTGFLPPARATPYYGDVTALQGSLHERREFAEHVLGLVEPVLSGASDAPPAPAEASPGEAVS